MKLTECRLLLSVALDRTTVAAKMETVMGRTGTHEREMAHAYLNDGISFAGSGDPVNTLASFWYAFGWLHFANASGTLITDMKTPPCPFTGPVEQLPPAVTEKLLEKTARYERLLETARSSVTAAPDPSSPQSGLATGVLSIAEVHAIWGRWLVQENRYEDALAAFSYGHGWLDAGVSAGLFTIHANREIFTVD